MDILLQQIINGLVLGSMYALIALGYDGVRHYSTDQFRPRRSAHDRCTHKLELYWLDAGAMPGAPGWVILLLATLIACIVAASLNFVIEKSGIPAAAQQPAPGSPDHRHRHVDLAADAGHDHLEAQLQALSHDVAQHAFPGGRRLHHPTQILILGVTAIALASLVYLVNHTNLGRAMRATAENPRVASLMGVKPDMVISATFIIGAILAAIAGMMYASNYGTAQHTMGFLPGLKAFTAAVFGGIGNLAGAVVGGILLGLIEAIGSGYIGTLTGGLLGSHYTDIFAFIVLIIILTLRPSGLLGERVADRA